MVVSESQPTAEAAEAEEAANRWLAAMTAASTAGSGQSDTGAVLTPDGSWRDVVALTGDIRSISDTDELAGLLGRWCAAVDPHSVRISPAWAPRHVIRADRQVIEVFFDFATALGPGLGVARLAADDPGTRAWTVLTTLSGLQGHPERFGQDRPEDLDFAAHFGRPNWLDRRTSDASFTGREPAVLVIGAGQAGLTVAARLRALGVDVLCVERSGRVGDGWRNRYHSLHLHNEIDFSHLPYLPFPATWPTYISKDQMASWLEYYAEAMEVDVWTGTRFREAVWDEQEERWSAVVEGPSGFERTLHPRHVVVATGVSATPRRATVAGLENFQGRVVHSSEFTDAAPYRGAKAIVFGVGNSGSDIAQDLHAHGCEVTMVQRGSITVVSHNPGSLLLFGLYRQGWPLDVCDLINIANPGPAALRSHQAITREVRKLDEDLIAGLNSVGFKTDYGTDDSGYGMKYFRSGGGHYLNVGCSELLIDGRIGLIRYGDIDAIEGGGARLRSGRLVEASLLVLATGYETLNADVARCFGAEVSEAIGPVWGLDDEGELRNMWRPTAQPGLWFHAGSLYQCRVFSRYLALQIAARELGHLPAGA